REWFSASGDVAHLRAAVKHLETAARLLPDNALVLGNLSDVQQHAGFVAVLDRWLQTRTLLLGTRAAETLLECMLSANLRDEVLDALQKESLLRKSLEVSQQQLILAPQDAGAYRNSIRWADWTRDTKGMEALLKRLDSMPPFDVEEAAGERRKWESGEKD